MKLITTVILFLNLMISTTIESMQHNQVITRNKMTVSWSFSNDRVFFETSAPTEGWIAIGFNTQTSITNTYLIMGVIDSNNKVVVQEHYVISPGNYKSFEALGAKISVKNIESEQQQHVTRLRFSLPIKAIGQYKRSLKQGEEYVMTMAFSREKDFQHHSIMRTSAKIKL